MAPANFYDLSTDPDEENNLYGNPAWEEQIQRLKVEMEEWFDRYTDPKMDARKGGAVGRGQEKMCYEGNAFDQSIEYTIKIKKNVEFDKQQALFGIESAYLHVHVNFNVMDNMKSSMNKKNPMRHTPT